ncbi:MAG: lipoate--protein ligase [Fuerstiella sp.]|nr:lipoate--protein ligase [Fuerstiella sp.]MCP4858568.1 lipoate--protein ligase [Fuerstiella sp.]
MVCALPLCDVIVDPGPRTGQQNMAIDEWLLQHVADIPDRSFVRVYSWCEPTITLGYFQDRTQGLDPRLVKCPRVRRLTGGGAILHDQEITYSCVIPQTHPLARTPTSLYATIHEAIIALMARCGVECCMRQEAAAMQEDTVAGADPFLCFLRSDPRDVILAEHKVTGSAQRRRRGKILQHGSVLLRASGLTPEIPGVADLKASFSIDEFERCLPEKLAAAVATDFRLTPDFPEITLGLTRTDGHSNTSE